MGSLLIHCQVGVSRSTAIALAILADRLGPGQEGEALQALLRLRPQAIPNLLVVSLADDLLARNGALRRAVSAWDETIPANKVRRREQRQAYFQHYGVPRTAEPALFDKPHGVSSDSYV